MSDRTHWRRLKSERIKDLKESKESSAELRVKPEVVLEEKKLAILVRLTPFLFSAERLST